MRWTPSVSGLLLGFTMYDAFLTSLLYIVVDMAVTGSWSSSGRIQGLATAPGTAMDGSSLDTQKSKHLISS